MKNYQIEVTFTRSGLKPKKVVGALISRLEEEVEFVSGLVSGSGKIVVLEINVECSQSTSRRIYEEIRTYLGKAVITSVLFKQEVCDGKA